MKRNEALLESCERLPDSATSYKAVDLTSVDYSPTNPFRALHIGGAGNITITGLDGQPATLAVTPGLWPYAGINIIRATTTATLIVALS